MQKTVKTLNNQGGGCGCGRNVAPTLQKRNARETIKKTNKIKLM